MEKHPHLEIKFDCELNEYTKKVNKGLPPNLSSSELLNHKDLEYLYYGARDHLPCRLKFHRGKTYRYRYRNCWLSVIVTIVLIKFVESGNKARATGGERLDFGELFKNIYDLVCNSKPASLVHFFSEYTRDESYKSMIQTFTSSDDLTSLSGIYASLVEMNLLYLYQKRHAEHNTNITELYRNRAAESAAISDYAFILEESSIHALGGQSRAKKYSPSKEAVNELLAEIDRSVFKTKRSVADYVIDKLHDANQETDINILIPDIRTLLEQWMKDFKL